MKKQVGMTFLGMLLTVAVIVLIGVSLMKIIPVYVKYYSVLQSVNHLEQIPSSDISENTLINVRLLKAKLSRQFEVNNINIPDSKIRIKSKNSNSYQINITYQEKRSLVSNISLLFDFDISREVKLDKP